METASLLPVTMVTVYDAEFRGARTRMFNTPDLAAEWIAAAKLRTVSVYRIERENGTWRTDWTIG